MDIIRRIERLEAGPPKASSRALYDPCGGRIPGRRDGDESPRGAGTSTGKAPQVRGSGERRARPCGPASASSSEVVPFAILTPAVPEAPGAFHAPAGPA